MALISNNSHLDRGTSSLALAILAGILLVLGCGMLGCAVSPAEQEATRRAWAERDAERERECLRGQGRWVAGGCVLGGGSGGM
jgi:hypothetical protein